MLNIHKPNHKLLILVITSICGIGALLSFSVLTYTPELSHAETTIYNPPVPRYHPNLLDITHMQDMTEEVCRNSYENDTKQLVDKRDSKTYWVTKLKDGNCWMTQNLDLDLYVNSAGRKLITTDSDVLNDWTSSTGASDLWSVCDSEHRIIQYYDPGEYTYTKPTNRLSSGCGALDSTACANAGWKLMSGASTDNSGNEMTHYLTGNHYSWWAAVAGQAIIFDDSTVYPVESTQSICPKSWRLPTNSGDKSYVNLFATYGTLNGLNAGTQDIRLNPLYFMYSGRVGTTDSVNCANKILDAVGNTGYYWSSTIHSSGSIYNLLFHTSIISPYIYHSYYGLPIRCVARGEATVRPNAPSVNNISAAVVSTISLDVADEVNVEKSETNPSTANLDVKVSSNQKYTLGISTSNPNLTSSTSNVSIPAKDGLLNTAENGWGIKLKENTEFTALSTNLQTFYTASGAEIKTIPFIIGISTAPDIPNGEYSTDVTVTATQN